jgi:hypothetical protein
MANPSTTLGGVVYLGGALSFAAVGLNVSNISAKSGAALYISGTSAFVNVSRFVNMTATDGPGGAIFFGANSGFSLYGTRSQFVIFVTFFFIWLFINNYEIFFFFDF